MGDIWPKRSTGITARVRLVTAAAAASGFMLNVSASMSANTGFAPELCIIPAVAKKVNGVVITSWPAPMSSARSESSSASEPFAQPIAMLRVRERRDLPLEVLHRLAENEGLILDDAHHRRHDLLANSRVLRAQVEQRDGHQVPMGAGSSRRARTAAARATSCHSCSERTWGGRKRSESIASHAAFAAEIVVVYGMRCATAAWRIV